MKIVKILIFIILYSKMFFAQDENNIKSNNFLFDGNVEFKNNKFPMAEYNYRKAYSIDSLNSQAPYNLANSLYKNNFPSQARYNYIKSLENLKSKDEKYKAFHNLGNTYMKEKDYKNAVGSYKNALLNNPDDDETRYNYVLAKELLKKQNNKQENKKNNKDKNKKEDKEKKENDNSVEDGKNQKNDKDKENNENKSRQKEKPNKQKISPEQLKMILEAMSKEEKKVREKINKKKFKGTPKSNKKDW
tara:strand:- start:4119 stop:4856 length:738 start_codon:yes stop_codon:yes gene_type:complete